MEREKIVIKDSKRNPQKVIYSDHPCYEFLKLGMMPDDYRDEMARISDFSSEEVEEHIGRYYDSIKRSEASGYGVPSFLLPIGVTRLDNPLV